MPSNSLSIGPRTACVGKLTIALALYLLLRFVAFLWDAQQSLVSENVAELNSITQEFQATHAAAQDSTEQASAHPATANMGPGQQPEPADSLDLLIWTAPLASMPGAAAWTAYAVIDAPARHVHLLAQPAATAAVSHDTSWVLWIETQDRATSDADASATTVSTLTTWHKLGPVSCRPDGSLCCRWPLPKHAMLTQIRIVADDSDSTVPPAHAELSWASSAASVP